MNKSIEHAPSATSDAEVPEDPKDGCQAADEAVQSTLRALGRSAGAGVAVITQVNEQGNAVTRQGDVLASDGAQAILREAEDEARRLGPFPSSRVERRIVDSYIGLKRDQLLTSAAAVNKINEILNQRHSRR